MNDWETYEAADKVIQETIQGRIIAGNKQSAVALRRMVNWKPERGFPFKKSVYGDAIGSESDENQVPFFCETFLYALLGKDDARTLLSLLGDVAKGLGFDGVRDDKLREEP